MSSLIGTSELSYLAIFLILASCGIYIFQQNDLSFKESESVGTKAKTSGPIPVIIFKLPRTGFRLSYFVI